MIRDRDFRRLLILSAVVGLVVSLAAWAFLTIVPFVQDLIYMDLPGVLGFSETPWWWPLPVLAIAGVLTALAILKLPGTGGGVPADGLSAGVTEPSLLPGIIFASMATLGFGLVLGPSSPVIALGMGLGLLLARRLAKDASVEAQRIISASGGFAALAMVFSNPIIAAIVVFEAAGVGGVMAPLLVLPGLVAAGIGSLVYIGMGHVTGLSTNAFALPSVDLPPLEDLAIPEVLWAVPIAIICAGLGILVVALGKRMDRLVNRNLLVWLPIVGVAVAILAILFSSITGESNLAVLFSGSRALTPLMAQADTLGLGVVAWLLLFKSTAWMLSMGSFKGGPVFPAIFIGVVAGMLASYLPGMTLSTAIPITVAATVVSVLRLPLSASVLALLVAGSAGLDAIPLIIIGMVVAYIVAEILRARFLEIETVDEAIEGSPS
jgi:H+/Cl- antiporter ClcA